MKLALLLLAAGYCIWLGLLVAPASTPEVEKICPATVIWMPCEACPACPEPPGVRETIVFWKCMRGPGVLLRDVIGVDYVPCDWIVDCAFLDRDQNGYLDLKDYAEWQRSLGK